MKRRVFLCSLLIGAVALLVSGAISSTGRGRPAAAASGGVARQERPARLDPPGTVVGAQSPEAIPDEAAYLILLRMLAGRQTEQGRASAGAYLRQTDPSLSARDVDALLAAADEFHARVSVLDRAAKAIKDRNWPDPPHAALERLADLQRQKEAGVREAVGSLSLRMSPAGLAAVKRHVNERVKPRMKIFPPPQSLPGGGEWRPRSTSHSH